MRTFLALLALASTAHSASTVDTSTALRALKVVPKTQMKNVARIEAREGKPVPSRWHILVHDKETENGVREYVVAGGELVASRTVSQFVEALTDADVITAGEVKIDSDDAAQIAQQYALANNAPVASMSYELSREGAEAAPLWKVRCQDENGREVGSVVLTASRGTVISHSGFPIDPKADKRAADGFSPVRTSHATEEFEDELESSAAPAATNGSRSKSAAKKRTTSSSRRRTVKREDPNFFKRAGKTITKFFTGRK